MHNPPPLTSLKTPISDALLERLISLPFSQFEQTICLLLSSMGYLNPRVLTRRHFKGRHAAGGADLAATYVSSGIGFSTLAVLKQFKDRPVQLRFLHELSGVMLSRGISRGLLVTTSIFPPGTIAAAKTARGMTIDLIDGATLVGLLIRHRIGVVESWEPRTLIDDAFFAQLSTGKRPAV